MSRIVLFTLILLTANTIAVAEEAVVKAKLKLLLDAFEEDVVERRATAAASIKTSADRALLLKLLNSRSADMRYVAADVLIDLPKQSAAEQRRLLELMDDEASTKRGPVWFPAALAIGASKPFPVAEVRKQLRSKNWVRRRAGLIAAHRSDQAGAPLVKDAIELLSDENEGILRATLGFFQNVGEPAAPARDKVVPLLKHRIFHIQYWAARALGAMGEKAAPAAPHLVDRLQNGVGSVRRNAALALGKIGPAAGEESAKALVAALADRQVPVVEAAAEALGTYKPYSEMASEPLLKKLEYPAAEVKIAVAQTLGKFDLHRDECLYELTKVLKARDYPWKAAEVLGEYGKRAESVVPELISALEAKDVEARVAAVKALQKIGAAEGLAAIQRAAEDEKQEPWVRETAREVLKETKEGAKTGS